MESQLATSTKAIQLRSLADMAELAATIHRSKLAPKDLTTPEAIMVAMQFGMELGLSPMQALQSVAVINNRPVIWGDGALAIVKAHPECDDVIETFEDHTDEEKKLARCEVKRTGKMPVVRTFSVKDALRAGLLDKPIWKQYPRRMMQMRARAYAIRDAFPDALRGVSVREEVEDFNMKPAVGREVRPEAQGLTFPDEPAQAALLPPREPSDNDQDIPPDIDPETGLARQDLF